MISLKYDLNNDEDMEILNTYQADITGKFTVESAQGNRYILVIVYRGFIKLEFLKTTSSTEYVKAHTKAIEFFTKRGYKIEKIKIDNETSKDLENYLDKKKIDWEYVEPGNHGALKAERALRDAKIHLIAMLCTTDKDFPLKLWDTIQTLFEITSNSLRKSKVNPKISAYH
jgi:hypothetical protein